MNALRSPPDIAVVLAGGYGTRIRHVLPDLPKPLAPVAGRPFLEWVLRHLYRQGIRRVVLSTGYLADKVEAFAHEFRMDGLALTCVREAEPLGTAGGFVNALQSASQSVKQPRNVLVCNGDSLVLADFAPLWQALAADDVDAALLGIRVADASRYGTLAVDRANALLALREKQPGPGLINAGVYLLRPGRVLLADRRPLSFEHDLFPAQLSSGARIRVLPTDAPFIDIGTEASLKEAEAFIHRHLDRLS